jgi:hypothetical protein
VPYHFFQAPYLLGERGLRDVKTLCCASKVKLVSHRDEIPEVAELDSFIHISRVSVLTNKILDI